MLQAKLLRAIASVGVLVLCVLASRSAMAQQQDELSFSVKSDLSSFVMYADSPYLHNISFMALSSLSSAMRDAKTEEDFKTILIATRILYCQKVLEDLTFSNPNYYQLKKNFETELKNDLTSLKNATE